MWEMVVWDYLISDIVNDSSFICDDCILYWYGQFYFPSQLYFFVCVLCNISLLLIYLIYNSLDSLDLFFFFFFFCLFRATHTAYGGGSQARGIIGAAAASLHHSHSNMGSEPHLWPTWQYQILNPLSEARDQTSNLMVPSQICFHCTMM